MASYSNSINIHLAYGCIFNEKDIVDPVKKSYNEHVIKNSETFDIEFREELESLDFLNDEEDKSRVSIMIKQILWVKNLSDLITCFHGFTNQNKIAVCFQKSVLRMSCKGAEILPADQFKNFENESMTKYLEILGIENVNHKKSWFYRAL